MVYLNKEDRVEILIMMGYGDRVKSLEGVYNDFVMICILNEILYYV